MIKENSPRLALASLKRILLTGTRDIEAKKPYIGEGADAVFRDCVEDYARLLSDGSFHVANQSGRLTIRPGDVMIAKDWIEQGLL
ncbi:MAG TPA: hypothetical protein PKI66_04635 [Methanobacteriaceae archaeon]|nr:hypothetical protein [Methanobacteriaceae archaeon]